MQLKAFSKVPAKHTWNTLSPSTIGSGVGFNQQWLNNGTSGSKKSMNMGCGFNKETLGLKTSQRWAWDAALKTVKVKVVLHVPSALVHFAIYGAGWCAKRRLLGLFLLTLSTHAQRGVVLLCVCACVCVSIFSILPSHTFWCATRGRLLVAIAWDMQ